MIKNKNFSGPFFDRFNPEAGEVIAGCNIAQKYPHTVITNVNGLTFRNCNLVNCDLPEDAIVEDCNTTQISKCGHLHSGYDCADDCEHVISSEDIIVDGVVVETIREYRDIIL